MLRDKNKGKNEDKGVDGSGFGGLCISLFLLCWVVLCPVCTKRDVADIVHQCTSTSPAAGKWGHSPKAAQPCNSGLCKSAQQCARVHRGVGGGCTQRGWLCKGGTLCMWKHAACNRAPHFSTCFKLSTAVSVDFERGKTLRLCRVESISMHFNSPIPALSIFGNDFTWPSLKFIID